MTKEEILSYLKEHYRYSAETIFKNHFSEEYQEINKIEFPENFVFSQKLYHWLHNDMNFNMGLCVCGNRCMFNGLHHGYKKHCSVKCAANSKDVREKTKLTNLEKYGNACSLHGKEIEKKTKQTMIEKYGVDNPLASKDIQQKYKQTMIEKHGVEHPLQSKTIMEKLETTNLKKYGVKQVFLSDDVQIKKRQTCLEKYGVENIFAANEIKDKIKRTNLEKYGVEYPIQTEEIKEKKKQTCLEKYGVEYSSQSNTTKERIKQTCLERYGVEWFCMTKDCRMNSSNDSKPNREFAELLEKHNIIYEREFHLENYSYDFKVNNILVEINPTITHNNYMNVFDGEPTPKDYHLKKSECAKKHSYYCIHIWDWDDISKIMNMLKPKETLYARKLKLKDVPQKECDEFLNAFHLQNTCKGQTIRYGLYKDDVLVQVMTFGKPRYNKNYKLELLRLCSHEDYKIVGGTEKLFKYILDIYKPESIISYCDNSKFTGDVYERLGFKKHKFPKPSKHWYNTKTKQHITDNLLRQRGFDQLFNANYGKGTSNEELMIEYNFLPVYDCGQTAHVFVFHL